MGTNGNGGGIMDVAAGSRRLCVEGDPPISFLPVLFFSSLASAFSCGRHRRLAIDSRKGDEEKMGRATTGTRVC